LFGTGTIIFKKEGEGGRGLGPGKFDFFGSEMALAYRLDAISQCPKKPRFPEPNPLPLALVKDPARIKCITHGAV
jgi:hypothetical protein